jgi:hypothetical protein
MNTRSVEALLNSYVRFDVFLYCAAGVRKGPSAQ